MFSWKRAWSSGGIAAGRRVAGERVVGALGVRVVAARHEEVAAPRPGGPAARSRTRRRAPAA